MDSWDDGAQGFLLSAYCYILFMSTKMLLSKGCHYQHLCEGNAWKYFCEGGAARCSRCGRIHWTSLHGHIWVCASMFLMCCKRLGLGNVSGGKQGFGGTYLMYLWGGMVLSNSLFTTHLIIQNYSQSY